MKLSLLSKITVATLMLFVVAPSGAYAIMPGAESNALLVNSTATPDVQSKELDRMKQQGVQVVRVNFGWGEIAQNCSGKTESELSDHLNGCYNWSIIDSLVKLAGERKLRIVLSTSRVPDWLHPVACAAERLETEEPFCYYMGASQAEFNQTVSAYSAFLKAAGTRYKNGSEYGTIQYWTIWNEPNSAHFWTPTPNAARYAQLYAISAQALKGVYPAAKVAAGPTGPASKPLRPYPFIQSFQANVVKWLPRNGARKYIDAWAHNPYPLLVQDPPSKQNDKVKKPNIGMSNIRDLFTLLDSKPITRNLPVWATEFGWETAPDEVSKIHAVSRPLQAQFVGEAYDWLDRTGRVTIGIWYGLTDGPLQVMTVPGAGFRMTSDWQSGTYTMAGVAKPSFKMYQRMISVPTGLVKKGTVVNVWGRSNLVPAKGRLVYCVSTICGPKSKWMPVKGVKRKPDGTMTARFKMMRTTQFAVTDTNKSVGGGFGMTRKVVAR